MKNMRFYFYLKIFLFLFVKFSIYINRRVFVMDPKTPSLMTKLIIFLFSSTGSEFCVYP